MSQHDYDVANGGGATVRADLNAVLGAIATNNSGASAPSTTFAHEWWADTTSGLLQQRNAANTGWIVRGSRSALAGLALANNVSDATNDIDIAVGTCRDSGNLMDIVLASALTKQLDAAWAVGTNAGMRASGAAIADTTYHIFAIRRPDTGVVDVAADTSATGANIAANTNANYTQIRRIGSIVRASAAIKAFIQDGDKFVWTAGPITDVNAANPGTTAVTRTLTLPVGIRVEAIVNAALSNADSTGGGTFRLSDLSTTDVAAAVGNAQVANTYSGAGNTMLGSSECRVHTNTSAQIRSRAGLSSANVTVLIGTVGWIDRRGRDD